MHLHKCLIFKPHVFQFSILRVVSRKHFPTRVSGLRQFPFQTCTMGFSVQPDTLMEGFSINVDEVKDILAILTFNVTPHFY